MKKAVFIIPFLFLFLALAVAAPEAPEEGCSVDIKASSTAEFIAEIPSVNAQLSSCPMALPGPAKTAFSNEDVAVKVTMQDGSTKSFTIKTTDGKVSGVSENGAGTFIVISDECAIDSILKSENMLGALAFVYRDGRASVSAKGFFKKLKLLVLKPFLNGLFKKVQTPLEYVC